MAVKMVNLTIDNHSVSVPAGTLLVDAAKKVGIDIPVFCYHPKLEPVGMCRLCMVEIGRPVVDRATNQPVLEADGSPKLAFGPKLETACTTPVTDGMVVMTDNDKAAAEHKDMLEFLLTSHPLDCPVCDKGGECPLQDLTMRFGPGKSRFLFDEKKRLAKQMPLGELIILDRERCIQCARCVRFQDEIVDDPVIGFSERGRSLEIITYSEPGFDSIFSGNTTDICPVGALTTIDFRFKARPWELNAAASICTHCPVGCNLTINVRREARSGGRDVVKRIMPRQNEKVNEIWICDKGRFAHHFTESDQRLTEPMMRKGHEFVPVSWEEALQAAASQLKKAGDRTLALAGGRLANEDLFNLRQLALGLGGEAGLYSIMGGGELLTQVGVGQGTNLGDLGPGSAILVIASDLHQEAPLWWLRVKQAAERGATLIVANARPTRLDKFAKSVIRYNYGEEVEAVASLVPEYKSEVSEAVRDGIQGILGAENVVVFFGSDGLSLQGTTALATACANLLVKTNHFGRTNNGLIGVWPNANTQGAFEIGYRSMPDLAGRLAEAQAVYIAGADPAGDDPALAEALRKTGFIIVQELFMTQTARMADLILPVQAFTEREGSFVSGERRVQRYYPAVKGLPDLRPDYQIVAQIGELLNIPLEGRVASLVFLRLAEALPDFNGLTYQHLAEVEEQWPIYGREDLYYGGTGYHNHQGMGVQLKPAAQRVEPLYLPDAPEHPALTVPEGSLLVVPITRLYDRGTTMLPTSLLHERMEKPVIYIHPNLATAAGMQDGQSFQLVLNGISTLVQVIFDENAPVNAALLPRSVGVPIQGPALAQKEIVSA
ncbi:MAG: NADH-quinone oxidoreductase subunit NuoG [Anaerolineaceae bacterium]|nr:NADH-quinone oxidoreductase subunit NuoG [Anaerolineaceae bacterium]